MLQRKVEKKIKKWIENSSNALLIDGARQVGKTTIIRKVLSDNNINYLEFNLLEQPDVALIIKNSNSVKELISGLMLFTDQKLDNNSVIFFDEIQECSDIVTKIKFLVDDGTYKFILSGSLLGVSLNNIVSAPVGYMDSITMYPLDFEEFLQIYNFDELIKEKLLYCFKNKVEVDETLHKRLIQLFTTYLLVGGMPAAVNIFIETNDYNDVYDVHENIILQYKNDFTKYQDTNKKLSLMQIYDLISAEINNQNKRFVIADLCKNDKARYTQFENSFIWLNEAGVAIPVYNITEPKIPLLINEKSNLFKLFLSDIGLLTTMYGKSAKRAILTGNKDINNGSIYENVVAQELLAHGFKPYYYNNKKSGELDFVVEYNGKVLPIEVKSGKDYQRHSALSNIMLNDDYRIKESYVLSEYNLKVVNNVVYLPIYMLMFIDNNEIDIGKAKIEKLSF